MEDLGSEQNFGWNHWVLIRKIEFSFEHATFVRSLGGSCDLDVEVTVVAFVGLSIDTNN